MAILNQVYIEVCRISSDSTRTLSTLLSRNNMSNSKPLIVVVGATGSQGSSVVDYLLNDPDQTFRVRAITRDVNSAKAKGESSANDISCYH